MLDERYSKKDPKTKAKAFSRKLGEVVVREPQVLISDGLWMISEDCLSESYPEELETKLRFKYAFFCFDISDILSFHFFIIGMCYTKSIIKIYRKISLKYTLFYYCRILLE